MVSVSSWSYIFFYLIISKKITNEKRKSFLPPLGVIFSLIRKKQQLLMSYQVGFRLLSELYSLLSFILFLLILIILLFPSPLGVIFSLICWIDFILRGYKNEIGFRLLSELYSLLYNSNCCFYIISIICFRLLSELYSLLFLKNINGKKVVIESFRLLSELYSLLFYNWQMKLIYKIFRFRLLSELYSLLCKLVFWKL